MIGHLVERIVDADLDPAGSTFAAVVEAAPFARVAYYDRPMVVTDSALGGGSATPNRPRFPHALPSGRPRLPLSIQVVAPRVVRLRLGPQPDFDPEILLDREAPGLPLNATRWTEGWRLAAGEVRIEVEAVPFRLRVVAADGQEIALADRDRNVFGQLLSAPLAVLNGTDGGRATLAWALTPDERIYGLGERFAAFDQRGRTVRLWATDAWGTGSAAAYKNCPLVCSSRGYGVFLHTIAPVEADLGATAAATAALTVDEPGLDLFLLLGPDLKSVLGDYTALTGRMPMLPRWVFGLWASRCRYQTRAEVEAVVARMRAEEIPLDVVNLDPAWLRTPNLSCDFVWNEDAFPDPAGFVRRLADDGVKVCLWECPYLDATTSHYAEAVRRGFVLRTPTGEPTATVDGSFAGDGRARAVVDLANPEAAAWWKDLHRPLLELGVAAFKPDFGEGVPPETRSATGLDGKRLRNLLPLRYNRAVWEATAEARGEGFVWGRSGWAGSQRYPAQWGGDPATSVDGLAACLRGGLNWALSAPGAWSHDIGGFSGPTPSPALYIRWAQCGLLSPLARFHGTTPREPWEFGEEAIRIFREYARLRYRLLPYLFAIAWEAHRRGLPMLRPLVLEFPEDRGTWDVDDQYLLGSTLLVAPILSDSPDPVRRSVYLPAGEWIDFWSGERLTGGRWLDLTVPLDRLPLYQRFGSPLPMGPEMSRVDAVPTDPLTIRWSPAGATTLELPEADGSLTRLAFDAGDGAATLTIAGSVRRRYDLAITGIVGRCRATLDGASVVVDAEATGARVVTEPTRGGSLRLTW